MVAAASAELLGDFNILAGDAEARRHVSVVGEDWGQDVAALGRLARERGIDRVHFVGIGHTGRHELARLGITPEKYGCRRPEKARWLAVHDSKFVRQTKCYNWLPAEPRIWVKNHIRVYELPDVRATKATRTATR
jgi:hypothetical protein